MKTLVVSASQNGAIDRAVEKLVDSELVAVPTETVYGLAADALNDDAVQKIYVAKGRPSHNPLICHVSGAEMAKQYVALNPLAEELMHAFWPGPLTFVLPQLPENGIAPTVSAGLSTLAVRSPCHPTARAIIEALGRPIAAPSANPSGKLSPTCAQDVLNAFDGKIALIIDGGTAEVGIESTIVSVSEQTITLLRPGSITADDIAAVADAAVSDDKGEEITAPGQLASHYAPNANVLLNQRNTGAHYYVSFGSTAGDINLSPDGNLEEAAKNLFHHLRIADQNAINTIAIAPIPNEGIGIAINDRLKRAAAPRGLSNNTQG